MYLILIMAACCLTATAIGQPSGPAKGKYIIPFRLMPDNTMVLQAVLNGMDTVRLLWHTAAGDVTLTEETARNLHSIQWEGKVDSVKSWGGGSNAAEYSRHNSLEIGGLMRQEVTIWTDLQSGPQTNGKIGPNFFAGKVVEMDFDRDRIIVSGKLPRQVRKFTRLPLVAIGDQLFVRGCVILGGDSLWNDYLIHSGYAGDLLLDDAFVNSTGIGKTVAIVGEKRLTDAFGHTVMTRKALLPLFWLGGQSMPNVPAGFFEGAIGRQKMSVLGCDILKRFDWIVDADRKFIYLKPSRRFAANYPNG